MKDIQVVSFDAGGTLIYAYPSVGEIYAESMGRFGLEGEPDTVAGAFERSWERAQHRVVPGEERQWWYDVVLDVVEHLGGSRESMDFEGLFDELWETFADPAHWRLYEEALLVLETLRQRGYRLVLLSNWDLRLRGLLAGLGVEGQFEHLVISAEVGAEKPDVAIFRHAENCFDLPPHCFFHVGDSHYHDVAGARNAGWRGIQVAPGQGNANGEGPGGLDDLLPLFPPR